MANPRYSVIVPVYNRNDEVADLLESLNNQTERDFEVILVEDGSTLPCTDAVEEFGGNLDLHYYHKSNEGRSIARNYGIERSRGDM
ncbi:MAG: glycosyltransferase, partial [Paramuribaculum sp.]|nr:glycosyltransferase [Paramuribaculum sp.]